jgi:hypothetical protein
MPAELQLWSWLYFAIGLTVFGIFGAFTYYLPELFPTRLRGTGSGFCYNTGRLITAIDPFVVGGVASRSDHLLQTNCITNTSREGKVLNCITRNNCSNSIKPLLQYIIYWRSIHN